MIKLKKTKQKQQKFPNNIPRNPTLGIVVRRICVMRDTLYCAMGSGLLHFKSQTQPFLNLGTIVSGSSDYLNMANDYTLCKLKSITVEVQRVSGEIALNASGLVLQPVFLTFFAGLINDATASLAINNENALVIPGLTLESYTKTYPTIPIISPYFSTGIALYSNPKDWTILSSAQNYPGQFSVGWSNVITATASIDLYSVQFFLDMLFAGPY